jgi:outer membrane protein assembly factor BamD
VQLIRWESVLAVPFSFVALVVMQIRKKAMLRYVLFIGLYTILITGCGGSVDIRETQTDVELFEQGQEYYERGEYKKALKHFLYVKDNFLRSSYAGVTRFYAGESYFELEKYADAVIEYKSFLSFFPNDPNAPIAQYKLGVSHLKQSLAPDRDQSVIYEALVELQAVLKNYPDNEEYVEKAKEQIRRTEYKIALYEFLIAKFYRKEDLYNASNRRLTYLMSNYPKSALKTDALYMMGRNYLDSEEPENAKEPFLRLLQEHPDSQYTSEVQKRLAKLGVSDIPALARAKQPQEIPSAKKTPAPSEPGPQPPAMRGYIVLKRDNTLFTDLIRSDGIQEGMILEIRREDQLVGTIRITEIQEGFSIGEISSLSPGMRVQEEDTVCCPREK